MLKRFLFRALTYKWPEGAKLYVVPDDEGTDFKTLWTRYTTTRKHLKAYAQGHTVSIVQTYCVHSPEPIEEFHSMLAESIQATEVVMGVPADVTFESEPIIKNGQKVAYNFKMQVQFSQEITKRKQSRVA